MSKKQNRQLAGDGSNVLLVGGNRDKGKRKADEGGHLTQGGRYRKWKKRQGSQPGAEGCHAVYHRETAKERKGGGYI